MQQIAAQVKDTIKNVNDLVVTEEIANVPFAIKETVPIFPGCFGNRQEKKSCLKKSIKEYVLKKFNFKIVNGLGLKSGKEKVLIEFKITKTGEIDVIGAKGPHKKIENEGMRAVKLLPKMIPGTQGGRNVNVLYRLPISFNIK